jgi:NitT/TauT family transport system ATP-binding protein
MHDSLETARSTGAAVRLRGVRRVFPGGVAALGEIDLDVPAGEFLAILGPSGCGKSTLLRMVAALDRPTEGRVDVDCQGANGRNAVAYVFQDAHLLPWRNVLHNVALPLELQGVSAAERTAAAMRAVEQVGLLDAVRRYPNQLSGGMRMRVSLARALVTDPRLLLLDEPFAALDEITRQRLDEQLRELWAARGMTVLFVTHSIGEAAFLAERAVVLSPRPGRVVLDRALDLPLRRTMELRTEPAFAREMKALFHALESGESSESGESGSARPRDGGGR